MSRAFVLLALLLVPACSSPGPPRVFRDDSVAPVQSRTRDRTLTAPSTDPGSSAPGLGTSEPTR